jgi:Zn finger protein HypA/HybF involved in hydrogenase expression
MSWDDDRKAISITKWQALFNHEGSVWETDYASVRTVQIDGKPSDDLIIKRKIATEISKIKRKELEYTHQKAQATRSQVRRVGPLGSSIALGDDYEDFLDDLGLEHLDFDVTEGVSQVPAESDLVASQDIDLIEVTDRSRIHVDIFPLTFRCHSCGHFQVVSENESDLTCPDCGKRMIQESIIFVCPHCADIEELAPRGKGPSDARNGVFECPKGCGGHLHFYRWGRLGNAYWRCSKCNYREQPVRRNCGCSIYADDQTGDSQVWAMRLNPTSASNTYSLQKTFVEVNKQDISLSLLEAKRKQDLEAGRRSWSLEDLLQSFDGFTRGIFRQTYDLIDAFMVNDVESSTVVYGYTTHVTSNRPIKESERLSKYFSRRGGRYRAYLIKSVGRGLVLVFDKAKIADVVQREVPTASRQDYDTLVDEELRILENGVFQENLDHPERFPIVSAMHAIQHALYRKATDEAGLEVFGSKALFRDAALLLFERQDVGEGGIVQLTTGQQFLRLANGIHSELSSCGQGCEKGCLSCTFIADFNCSPFLETECDRWYPGNSFLDRSLASLIIGPTKD